MVVNIIMSDLRYFVALRSPIRTQITRQHNNITANIATLTNLEKSELLVKIKSYKDEVLKLNLQISKAMWAEKEDEARLQAEITECGTYDDKIIRCIVLLENSLATLTPAIAPAPNNSISALKPPEAAFPSFSGADDEILNHFLFGFEAITSRYKLQPYEHFSLLKKQLSGRALKLIDSLDPSEQSYAHAKDLLTQAFAVPIKEKFKIIQRLTELKLTYDTDPYSFISDMRIIIDSFKTLKIDTDLVLQYFLWNGLNDTFKKVLVDLTNETKPSLKNITDNIFKASDRYMDITAKFKAKKSAKPYTEKKQFSSESPVSPKMATSNFAAAVQPKKQVANSSYRDCLLCSGDNSKAANHPIFRCPNYNDAKSKVDRLETLGACTKCAFRNHKSDTCRFKFKSQCSICKEYHFSFLCLKTGDQSTPANKSEENKTPKNPKQTNNGVVWMEALHNVNSGESILPTFTAVMANDRVVRCLKDSGCQRNFILESLADELNLKVKENMQITVNGFNSSKTYESKIVELCLKLGDKSYALEAITIPNIPTTLSLTGLNNVAETFLNKGYTLADSELIDKGDVIENLEMILGSEAAHCFEEKTVLFGNPNTPSVYLSTPFGAMLIGNIDNIKQNLKYLPTNPSSMSDTVSVATVENKPNEPNNYTSCLLGSDSLFSTSAESEMENVPKAHYSIVDKEGRINEKELKKATDEILNVNLFEILNYDKFEFHESSIITNDKLIEFTLQHTWRKADGRLVMPLMWNGQVSHLLGENLGLSKQILFSNLKKYQNDKPKLEMIEAVFKDQEAQGIIERIEDLDTFCKECPKFSFLPHMPVFRLEKKSSPCRVVFLSNLKEKIPGQVTMSHNQAILSGPCLKRKITTAMLSLRFDQYLLYFDLKKAFLQIELNPIDQNRLLFLWFRNISKNDYSLIANKNLRLSFGLRNSPATLMIALYKILILDAENDPMEIKTLKKHIYHLIYMDNGSVTANDKDTLIWSYEQLDKIFNPYQFHLQQFVTNFEPLQEKIDSSLEEKTPTEEKLFGMLWNRQTDVLSTKPFELKPNANTKRLILQSIASNYDPFNYNGPILNRARLFMHGLQCNKDLGWDTKISNDLQKDWKLIAQQLNSSPKFEIPRYVGSREHTYNLIAFTDSSKLIYGTVIFLHNLDLNTVSFVLAKNRIINKQLATKSIPTLEFQSLTLGAEVLLDTYEELTGPLCVTPIKINELQLYTDSYVALNWLNSHVVKLDKMKNLSTFTMNRLQHLVKICEKHPIKFSFVSGIENPSDCITRPISAKQLLKTNYFSGPSFLRDKSSWETSRSDLLEVVVPNPFAANSDIVPQSLNLNVATLDNNRDTAMNDYLYHLGRRSTFRGLLNGYKGVFKCINILKKKLKLKNPEKYSHLKCLDEDVLYKHASYYLLRMDQKVHFSSIIDYFEQKPTNRKDIPMLVNQLNLYLDSHGLLRVQSKFSPVKSFSRQKCYFPILLSKHSDLATIILRDLHLSLSHAGHYTILSEIRKKFWIPHAFSFVKKFGKSCLYCQRRNNRTIKLNQNIYREFRADPPKIPFKSIFIDHMGPYKIKWRGLRTKVWVLCITCLWSRAINLEICYDLSTKSFLRAFQMHSFRYGLPEKCYSDMGSQLKAGANIIEDFIKDVETQTYFQKNNIQSLEFSQYYTGCHKLGGLVETCVKLTKDLISASIKKLVLDYLDFEFIICQTVHIVNRRPIAFKESLRENSVDELPEIITQECLIYGYNLTSLNVIPELQAEPEDTDWTPGSKSVKTEYSKLQSARKRLIAIYNEEFIPKLIEQAVDSSDRYKPITHKKIKIGDLVLLKEPFLKPSNYPMAIVREVVTNELDEVTGATIFKGDTRELVKRHVSSLIPLMTTNNDEDTIPDNVNTINPSNVVPVDQPTNSSTQTDKPQRKPRKAAMASTKRIAEMFWQGLI